jgi:hypothetical protein
MVDEGVVVEIVACSVCWSTFESAWKNVSFVHCQGKGCAASVQRRRGKDVIVGHYGSLKFDCEVWEFLGEVPEAYRGADPVCDDCFMRLIEQGLIRLREARATT